MTLHLYFARKFLMTILGVAAIFFALIGLLDLIEQLRKFDRDLVGFGDVVTLTLLNVPAGLYRILPLVFILGTLALFLSLARTSELVVTRAAGRSALRALMAPVVVTLLLGFLCIGALNPIVAATSTQYETRASKLVSGESSVLSVAKDGLWLRQGGAGGQTVIAAERSNLDGTRLINVTFLNFASDGTPLGRIEAVEAELTDGRWALSQAKLWDLATQDNPEAASETFETFEVLTDLTRDRIQDSFGTPSAIPIWELPGFIADLEASGFSASQHRVWFHMELALPLLLVAMVLIGAGFTMRHTRFGRTGVMVLFAVMMGFGLFFIRSFAQILGENGQIPIALAAWAPPIAAICLSLALLFHLEDG
ncbi:LPS export ABC transporter permease LptG [Algirhabdus cladophorae]|uniref:LPS export ABC transporter permease LptG n=1 Tax=Algirhabdus cladophorae TaxID=3377108 RepID=UPI003B845591